jgi:hypothetical protein
MLEVHDRRLHGILYDLLGGVFSVGNWTGDHYHHPWASSLSAIVVQLPGVDLPLTLIARRPPRSVHQGKGAIIVGGDVEAIKAKEMEAR